MPEKDLEPSFSPEDMALVELGGALKRIGYHFTSVTPLTHARINGRPNNRLAKDLAGVFGWSRPFGADLLASPIMTLMHEAGVLDAVEGGWRSSVRLSSIGRQLFFHSAYPTLSSDAVFFGPDTYRFASAIRGHLAASRIPIDRAVDIGCGAGPGGLVIARTEPDAQVLMVDINAQAIRLARINAALNEAANVEVYRSDILTGTDGSFDLIVSNPPYLIDPAERAYRHGGGHLGEGLSVAILKAAVARLSPGGSLLLYTGSAIVDGIDGFRNATEGFLEGTAHRRSYVEVDPDVFGEELEAGIYAQADRIAALVLTVTRED